MSNQHPKTLRGHLNIKSRQSFEQWAKLWDFTAGMIKRLFVVIQKVRRQKRGCTGFIEHQLFKCLKSLDWQLKKNKPNVWTWTKEVNDQFKCFSTLGAEPLKGSQNTSSGLRGDFRTLLLQNIKRNQKNVAKYKLKLFLLSFCIYFTIFMILCSSTKDFWG